MWPLTGSTDLEPPTPIHAGQPIVTTPPAGIPVSGPLAGAGPFAAPGSAPPHDGSPSTAPSSAPPAPPPYAGPPSTASPSSGPPYAGPPLAAPSSAPPSSGPPYAGPPASVPPAYGPPPSAPPPYPGPAVQPSSAPPASGPPFAEAAGQPSLQAPPFGVPAQPAHASGHSAPPPPQAHLQSPPVSHHPATPHAPGPLAPHHAAQPVEHGQGLQPPSDPWATTAPISHSPASPWATPPTTHQQPPPQQAPSPAPVPTPPPSQAYTEHTWAPEAGAPTAEEFARRRAAKPADPVARTGVRAAVNKSTLGLVKLAPGRDEMEFRQDIEKVRRNFGGLRQVTVVNPKGGAGKTVAVLLLAMTFGQKRGGYVLAWDNNETQGTLGMRAQQDFHSRTVRDMLRDLSNFQGARGRVGDLSQYVRAQGEGMFDVLASDESATAGEMLTAHAFGEIREVVSRFYKLIVVDTGNNVRAQNWQAAIDATDQLVVTMSARNDSAETAARMLDHLEQTGRTRLVRQAVTVVSMPPRARDIDLPPIQRHFAARTRAVLVAPYDRLIDTGEPLRYGQLSSATLDAWLRVAAAVSEGL
ncbi:chromosome partitioning protein [Micromonospora sp. CPCC 206061]